MMREINRRTALTIGAGVAAFVAIGVNGNPAYATNGFEERIAKFTGGKTPLEGRITLDIPEIAENGNTIPMTVSVESPMTEESHVSEVLVVNDDNPRPGIAVFYFSPSSGVAEVTTRIRLVGTQNVIAVAKMNDGSFYMVKRHVKVTIGGCGG